MAWITDERRLAHALARLGLGINIALHGAVRVPKLETFSNGLREQFQASILPGPLVFASGYGIVAGEVIIGVLLILGVRLKASLVAGMLLMILLITGSCLIENWNAAGTQMVYLAFYAGLLATVKWDAYSLGSRTR